MKRLTKTNADEFICNGKTIAHYEGDNLWHEYKFICKNPTADGYLIAFELLGRTPCNLYEDEIFNGSYVFDYTLKELYEENIRIYEARIEHLKKCITKMSNENV